MKKSGGKRRVISASDGELLTFEQFVTKAQVRAVGYAFRLARHQEVAEDVYITAILRLQKVWFMGERKSESLAWHMLNRAINWAVSDHFCDQKRRGEEISLEEGKGVCTREHDRERSFVLRQIIAEMEPEARTIIALKIDGWTINEIATHLAIHPMAAKSRIYRIRAAVQQAYLSDNHPEP